MDCVWLTTDNDLISLWRSKNKRQNRKKDQTDISGCNSVKDARNKERPRKKKKCTKAINRRKDENYHHIY